MKVMGEAMTIKQVQALNNIVLRIRAAELCGLKDIHFLDNTSLVYGYRPGSNEFQDNVPNYTDDYHACHKLEKVLSDRYLIGAYFGKIREINDFTNYELYAYIESTPRQRTEAFVLVMEEYQ